MKNTTYAREHTEFLFEFSTRYLTGKRSERVWYRVEHEKKNSVSPRAHELFCLLYKHASYWQEAAHLNHVSKSERVAIHSWC